MKKFYFLFVFSIFISSAVLGQKDSVKVKLDVGADLVSSYVWRGLQLDKAPNVQGWTELKAGPFFAGLWASTNVTASYGETDLYAGLAFGNFTATITDYFTGYENVFNFQKDQTAHAGELSLVYVIGEKFPLQITAGSLIFGSDLKLDSINASGDPFFNDQRNYSTYLELLYPFTIGSSELAVSLGGVTHESWFYGTNKAALINFGLMFSKAIKITDNFELPVAFQVVVNPDKKSVYSILGFSF